MSSKPETTIYIALPLDALTAATVLDAIVLRYPNARAGAGRPGRLEMSITLEPAASDGVLVPGVVDDEGIVRFPASHRCAATAALKDIHEQYSTYESNCSLQHYDDPERPLEDASAVARAMFETAVGYYALYADCYEVV
jgi:hypothetical protein